jgi:hypothetical protein
LSPGQSIPLHRNRVSPLQGRPHFLVALFLVAPRRPDARRVDAPGLVEGAGEVEPQILFVDRVIGKLRAAPGAEGIKPVARRGDAERLLEVSP